MPSAAPRLEDNLVLDLYRATLARASRPIVPLALRMSNEIPLGMGCGSSAAGRLAALALAAHFGELAWPNERILDEAARLEGHPDNAVACWHGGFIAATSADGPEELQHVRFARVAPPAAWRAIVVLPTEPLATSKARAVLPESYAPRRRGRKHPSPHRCLAWHSRRARPTCLPPPWPTASTSPIALPSAPMLPRILPLMGQNGILGASLSGAGPAMLVIAESEEDVPAASKAIQASLAGLSSGGAYDCQLSKRRCVHLYNQIVISNKLLK